MRAGGFEQLEATEAGLREGVFFERHLSKEEGSGSPASGGLRHVSEERGPGSPALRRAAPRPGAGAPPRARRAAPLV